MKVLIATGGSGGHVFPALRVAEELRAAGNEVYFLTTSGMAERVIAERGFDFSLLSAHGFYARPFLARVHAVLSMLRACGRSCSVLRSYAPDAVVGFGGYGSFSAVCMAWLFRIPTLIHEQNVVPGQANALLAKIVKKIALSFGRSLRYVPARKAVVTGCPCRDAHPKEHRDELRRFFGFTGDAPVVIALGGSQGSQRINDIFFDALQMLIRHRKVCVIHIAGAHDYERISRMSQGIPVRYRVFGFYDGIGKAYAIADCAVARAGAVTVVELDAFGIPAVLIPYPHAGGHQKHNALLLSEARGARIIDDAELTAEALARSIEQLLVRGRQSRPSTESEAVYMPDAARRIADEISRLK